MDCDLEKRALRELKSVQGRHIRLIDGLFKGLAKGARKIPTSEKWLIPTKLQEQTADMINMFNALRQNIYNAAAVVQKQLNTLSPEDSKQLVAALNGDLGKGLFNIKESLPRHLHDVYDTYRKVIDENAKMLVRAGLLDPDDKIEDYLKRFYKKHRENQNIIQKMTNRGYFKRQTLSYEDRLALGMIEDASYVISRTIADQRLQLMRANFLKQVDEMYGELKPLGDEYVKVPDERLEGGAKRYGALSGRYLPKDIKEILDSAHMLKEELGWAERNLFPLVDHIKVNVTVKNPVTHIYNVASNVQVATLDGSLLETGRIMRLAKSDKKAFKALIDEVSPFGFDSMLKDMENLELSTNSKGVVNIFKTIAKNVYLTSDSKWGKNVRKWYDWEDKFFKLGSYKVAKEGFEKKLGRELTDIEKRAVYKEAVAPYANYSTPLPGAWRFADKTGVMPFMHYVYKSTPAVAKLIMKHPLKYAAIQASLYTLGASMFTDKDDKLKPEWASKEINLFLVKEWANIGGDWYWNAGRMMPGMKFGLLDLDGGFVGSIFKITTGLTPLGYKIGKKHDSVPKAVYDRFMVGLENYAPPLTLGRYAQRGANLALGRGQKNYYDEDMSWGEFMGRVLGVRKFNRAKEMRSYLKKAQSRLDYFIKKDPQNEAKYRHEFNEAIKHIKAQGRTHNVRPEPKRRKSTQLIDLGMPKKSNMIGKPLEF